MEEDEKEVAYERGTNLGFSLKVIKVTLANGPVESRSSGSA